MNFPGDLEPLEDPEFTLDLRQFVPHAGQGLTLGEELALGEIPFGGHTLRPGDPVCLPLRVGSTQGDPGFKLLC